MATDPQNARDRRAVAIGYEKLAEVRAQTGDVPEALSFALQSLPIREALATADPLNARFRAELAQALQRVAALSVTTGHIEEARGYTQRALALQKAQADRPEATPAELTQYARALLTCEPVDLQEPEAALPYAQRAVDRTRGEDADTLSTLALAYHHAGDHARAVETGERTLALVQGDVPQRRALEAQLAQFTAAWLRERDWEKVGELRPPEALPAP